MKKRLGLKKVTLRNLDADQMRGVVGGETCDNSCPECHTCGGQNTCDASCPSTCDRSCYLYLCEYSMYDDTCQQHGC